MQAHEIPEELKRMLDDDAGKVHSDDGPVYKSLARILTRHREMVLTEVYTKILEV